MYAVIVYKLSQIVSYNIFIQTIQDIINLKITAASERVTATLILPVHYGQKLREYRRIFQHLGQVIQKNKENARISTRNFTIFQIYQLLITKLHLSIRYERLRRSHKRRTSYTFFQYYVHYNMIAELIFQLCVDLPVITFCCLILEYLKYEAAIYCMFICNT